MGHRMRKLVKVLAWAAGVLVVLVVAAYVFYQTQKPHHTASGTPEPIAVSGDRVLDGIRRGIGFLKARQEPDGEFSAGLLDPRPAFTAMAIHAIANSPDRLDEKTPFVAKAVEAILSHQQEDGGIYRRGLGLGNYCTCVSIMALEAMHNPAHDTAIQRARDYVLKCQRENGGMGYGSSGRPDLGNTESALEALRAAGLPEDSEAFKRAAAFVAQCQNNSETNSARWAGDDGGFIYRPGESRCGTTRTPDGQIRYLSYGLMSYAGLVSFLWAGVDRKDPRVQSAYRWVKENWTLDENCRLKDAGLYYYYLTMAKALHAYGERRIQTSDGVVHDWPVELSERILSLQGADGSWVNANARWMEDDRVLVTSFMVRALSVCREVVQQGGEAKPKEASSHPG